MNQSKLALAISAEFLTKEEGFTLHAYPDPMSPLGKALTKKYGAKGIMRIGNGAAIPPEFIHLDGSPWTIGYGTTGTDIVKGLVWTVGQCKDRFEKDLPKYYRQACNAFPGLEKLHPLAQAAIISLVYNRGTDLRKNPKDPHDRRLEMRELVGAIANADYLQMSALIQAMCRLWENQGLGGLIARRKAEAKMCLEAHNLSKG